MSAPIISIPPFRFEFVRFAPNHIDTGNLATMQVNLVGGGAAATALYPYITLTTGAAAANHAIQVCGASVDRCALQSFSGAFDLPILYHGIFFNLQKSGPTNADEIVGLVIGDPGSGLGSPLLVNPPSEPLIGLFAAVNGGNHWELWSAPGDGVTNISRRTLLGVTNPSAASLHHMQLIYKPGEYLKGIIDGVVGATENIVGNLPIVGFGPISKHEAMYALSGSTAASISASFAPLTISYQGVK